MLKHAPRVRKGKICPSGSWRGNMPRRVGEGKTCPDGL